MAEEKNKTNAKKKRSSKEPKKEKVIKAVEEKEEKVPEEVKEVKNGKKKKDVYSLSEVVIVIIVTLIVGMFVGWYCSYKRYNNVHVDCKSIDEESAEIINVYNDVLNNYYGEVDKQNLIDSAIKGMIYSIDDKYAAFYDSSTGADLNENLNGSFVGLGVEITGNAEGQIIVLTVFKDSPAEKNGIIPGDIILKLDSKEYDVTTLDDMVTSIKSSKPGTVRSFEILREGNVIKMDIPLDVVELTSVEYYNVIRNEKKIGYMRIEDFSGTTYNQFVTKYDELEKENISALVIDLRQNGGGYLSTANSILSLFLNKGSIVYQRTDGENVEQVINDLEPRIKVPVVLVVDSATASSSEVFVSSLKDNLDVTIVGEKTYGKGTIQKLVSLLNGRYIKFTVQEWLTPNGNKIEGVGIIPDVEVASPTEGGNDTQLETAFDIAASK